MRVRPCAGVVALLVTMGCGSGQESADLVQRPTPAPTDDALTDVREFMAGYARELAAGERAAIAERYDPAGSVVLLNGGTIVSTHAQTRTRYQENWTPPLAFAWDSLSYHPIEPGVVLVVGRFEWVRAAADTSVYSYGGILRMTPQGWRIRSEIETRLR